MNGNNSFATLFWQRVMPSILVALVLGFLGWAINMSHKMSLLEAEFKHMNNDLHKDISLLKDQNERISKTLQSINKDSVAIRRQVDQNAFMLRGQTTAQK